MRQNKSGAFEIYFVSEEGEHRENAPAAGVEDAKSQRLGANRFREVFALTANSPPSSEAYEAGGTSK